MTIKKRGNRSALFGHMEDQIEMTHEPDNEELGYKFKSLERSLGTAKEIAITIGEHISESNMELDGFKSRMGDVNTMLKKTQKLLKKIAEGAGASYMCWLILFVFAVIMVLYWMVRQKV